ncbi:ATP-binding protein [Brevundimonas sp. G8]|uniref:ATP-binding protein n=1 Tax=Brevundimonas sp. G8 TaxID=1350776 RepID=UPI001F46B1C5|nr:ATP-binding protein [Brevundimonas sp. G8]
MLSSIIGMAGVLGTVSQGIDAHQARKEEALVKLRLTRALEIIGENLTTASVWDEAVDHMTTGDVAWYDRTMGAFYAVQHKHHFTLGYDATGRLFRISTETRPASAEAGDPFARAARPLVDRLRAEALARDRSDAAVRLRSAFVRVDDTIYVLGASTVVRHTETGATPASDPVVASFKPFLSELDILRTRLALTEVHFQPGEAAPPQGMIGVDVRDAGSALLGRVVWAPERPGYQILTRAGPLLLLLMVVLIVGTAFLFWNTTADVRRLRASEVALSAALERAEAANQAKTRFLSNVSHELRTPLNGVLGMAEVIGADLVTPQQRDRLEILKASGRQQLRLVEELLDVVRLRDGAVTLEERPFRPDNLLRRVANDLSGAAQAKGLKIDVEAAEGEWLGDPVHVEKLMAALSDNAVRFTRTGQVILRAVAGDQLVLEVEDTGPGMEPEAATRLFDAFTQGDESSTRTAEGLGLGLTAAHGLAALMGGRIEVVTEPGVGSTFRVALPLEAVV